MVAKKLPEFHHAFPNRFWFEASEPEDQFELRWAFTEITKRSRIQPEASPMPEVRTLFTDVYAEPTAALQEQWESVSRESSEGTAEGHFPL